MRTVTLVLATVLVAGACSDAPTVPSATTDLIDVAVSKSVVTAAALTPAAGDRLLLDTRTSLQSATSLAQAWALFPGNDHSPARSAVGRTGWSFSANFDGQGTRALRADWRGTSGACGDQSVRIISYFPRPLPTQAFVQWKQRLGRHAADPTGNGAVDRFAVSNSTCRGGGRMTHRIMRDASDGGGAGNLVYWWRGNSGARPQLEQAAIGRVGGNQGWTFVPEQHLGRTITQTVFMQAESSPGAGDGIIRLWVDGRLYFERLDLAVGTQAFHRFSFPDDFTAVPQTQSEYFWDVVAWEPGSAPPPPPPPAPTPRVASVTVTPATSTLVRGDSAQFVAAMVDSTSAPVPGAIATWTSSDTLVATVSGTGLVVARGEGSASIAATSGGVSGTATLTVRPVPVARIVVTPTSGTLTTSQTLQLAAATYGAGGQPLTGRAITWSSNDSSIAAVSASGLVTARRAGSALVSATAEGASGSAAITVNAPPPPPPPPSLGCATPQSGWIWCDDFDQDRLARYFEYAPANGAFTRQAGTGRNGSAAMRAHWNAGQVGAGSLKLAFGQTPTSYMRPVDAGTANYREVYWRVYMKSQAGWRANGNDKMSRAIVFAGSSWQEAAIGHLWGGSGGSQSYLLMDPASGTDAAGNLRTTGYNDFPNLRWLGAAQGRTPILDATRTGQWYCVEAHMRLNDPGQSNGVFEFWVNGAVEAARTGLNWVGSYQQYGINALFLENYINDGAPQAQDRWYDDLVASSQRIGCDGTSEPTPAPVASVAVLVNASTLDVGQATQAQATPRGASGSMVTGRPVGWRSTNPAVASVSTSGLVTAMAAGSTSIVATVDGISGSAAVTVSAAQTVASVSVTPSSSDLPVNGTAQLSATVRDAAGSVLTGRTVTWSVGNPAVASVSASGLVRALAAGSTTVTAAGEGRTGTASVRVTAPPPPPPPTAGVPAPAAGAAILLDMRQALQQATTLDQAFGLFGVRDRTGNRGARNSSGWSFTTNADGQGLHALRADWAASAADQRIMVIHYLPAPKPTELYVQWKGRTGKHPADPDANGTDNSYAYWPESNSCKRALFLRGDDRNRVDFVYHRSNPTSPKLEMGAQNYARYGNTAVWNPNAMVGRTFTTTIYVKAASSSTATDGIFRLWIDGTLVMEQRDVPMGATAFDRWQFPDTCVTVPQPQAEYFWDILAWRP